MGTLLQRSLLILLLSAAGAILIFGPRAGAKRPQDRVVVTYWEKWTANEESQMKQIVDSFNETVGREKGIWVEYLSMSGVDRKTLVATAAGAPPDIAGMWEGNMVQFAALGAAEPLEDLAREHGITAETYKPVYWKACNWNGHLWALISTPAAVALHYNKRTFYENADELRAAGLDPTRPPRTLDELDRYAAVLDVRRTHKGRQTLERAGYLPTDPGWYLNYTCFWFGADLWNAHTGRFTLTDPGNLRAMEWIRGYTLRLGKESISEHRSAQGNFDSPQNSFFAGTCVMQLQGPWMPNFIEQRKPTMARALVPRTLEPFLPRVVRPFNYDCGVAPLPSAGPELEDVTFCGFDTLMIPRGCKRKREAFEFIAYVNRQDVMERLTSMHCKNSPLAKVSDEWVRKHPNPYIAVFEKLARSPNARCVPQVPIWPEASNEIKVMIESAYTLDREPAEAARMAQERLQHKYARYLEVQQARTAAAEGTP